MELERGHTHGCFYHTDNNPGNLGLDTARVSFGMDGHFRCVSSTCNSNEYNEIRRVTYTSSLTTGPEIPTSSFALNALTISAGPVTLGSNATANGASSIASSITFNTGAFALTIGSGGSLSNSGTFNVNSSGTFALNSAASITGTAPVYAAGSLLKYPSGATSNRGLEWSSTSGAGYPANVELNRRVELRILN